MANYFSYSTPSLDAKDYARRRMSRAQERWFEAETSEERQLASHWAVAWGVLAEAYPNIFSRLRRRCRAQAEKSDFC